MKPLRIFALLSILFVFARPQAATAPGYMKCDIRDLVLLYQGGVNRLDFTADQIRPYVVHADRFGNRDWMFDGFLFLEFQSGNGVTFEKRGNGKMATKDDWAWLKNRHFEPKKGINALDECISQEIDSIGEPPFRHKTVIGLPEPIIGQKDWGTLDGKTLDFDNDDDRLAACKWYIDLLKDEFEAGAYKNIDLSGFYWISEKVMQNSALIAAVADYIHSLGYKFYWIPYYTAQGFSEWRQLGFDAAYLQPTYFWNKKIQDDRVDRACQLAKTYNMGLEMEFDMAAAIDSEKQLRNRAIKYLTAFRKNGALREASIAYYEGGSGVYRFSKKTEAKDRELIDTIAHIIQERREWLGDNAAPRFLHYDFKGKTPDSSKWNIKGKYKIHKNKLILYGNSTIDTRGLTDIKYGRFDILARLLNHNKDVKVKIHLMPTHSKLGSWPKSGDAFMMDYCSSRPDEIACGAATMQMNRQLNNIKQSVFPFGDIAGKTNKYSCDWTERDIVFSVNDIVTNIQEDLFDDSYSYYPQGWPFNNDTFYLEITTEAPDDSPVLEIDTVDITMY